MADEEQEEQPKRRRRRTRGTSSEEASASEAATQKASAADASSEIEPDAADLEAEEATEVVLEADDEAEGEPEAEEPEAEEPEAEEPEAEEAAEEAEAEEPAKPARRRRRRGAAAEEEAAEPPKPAPTRRRRAQRDPNLPPPVVRAQAKYVRSSARKARLVCDHIRGKTVDEARAILAHTPRAVARDWSKLLESAVANAEHNHELVGEDLYVKAVHADEGPTIKRFRPRAMGRATRIRKRTAHLTILLTPKD
jgi:large subunit ribosomal protein L22